jgi:hypothetical protein
MSDNFEVEEPELGLCEKIMTCVVGTKEDQTVLPKIFDVIMDYIYSARKRTRSWGGEYAIVGSLLSRGICWSPRTNCRSS